MRLDDLLATLKEKDVTVWVRGENLVVRGPKGAVDESLLASMRQYKPRLLDMLRVSGTLGADRSEDGPLIVPPTLIPRHCPRITPAMLPLVQLTQREIDTVVDAVPGGASNVADIYPLAPLQEGMLFHHVVAVEDDPYVLRILHQFDSRTRLDGYLDAFRITIERHQILRTSIVWEGVPEPLQVVWHRAFLPLEEIRLGQRYADAVTEFRESVDRRAPRLDPRVAPMIRPYIAYDKGADRWLLLMLLHHLIVDHVTMDLLTAEIGLHLAGRASELPAAISFRNVVAASSRPANRQRHRAFFQRMLHDVGEPTVPFGVLGTAGSKVGRSKGERQIDPALVERLHRCAKRLRVSAASICHVACARVIGVASACEDVVFGTVLFGRMATAEEADRALGLFINTLPIRVNFAGQTVERSVRDTHALLAELLRHEHASLALAQRCSGVAAPAPLFTTLFNYRHGFEQGRTLQPEIKWEGIERLSVEERAHYPLDVSVDDFHGEMTLTVEAQAPVDAGSVCSMTATVLDGIVAAMEQDPTRLVSSIETLSTSDRRKLLEQWNATDVPHAWQACIHTLFEAHVREAPGAVAAVYRDQQMTYSELNRQANQIAHFLRGRGVGPDSLVILATGRGLPMLAGLLGILKAGGAYVPVDPSWPLARLAEVVTDCAPVVILSDTVSFDRIRKAAGATARIVDLTDAEADWADKPATDLLSVDLGLRPDHLAYVIYTSGTTGKPKGVMIEHAGLCNLILDLKERWRLTRTDVMLQFASITFDAASEEIFRALACGACLVLRDDSWISDPKTFWALCDRHQVTIVDLPTRFWQVLAEDERGYVAPTVRLLIISGEAATRESLVGWFRSSRSVPALWNVYGPTEATVTATVCPVTSADANERCIGRPISNVRIYILDRTGSPVPIYTSGEIYIGGAGVARGYLNEPVLTEERFQRDLVGTATGDRLYKSGDLGRWLADGTIEWLGRSDLQVKVNGFRVELGEIESKLLHHPSVRDAAVMAGDGLSSDNLIAYVASHKPREIALWPSVGEHLVYDRLLYHAMTHDELRNRSYRQAIEAVVKNKTVVEIGTGEDAILARFCIEAGARRVYAIELLEKSYEKAKALVHELNFQDRIVLIHGDATKVQLPDKVDVCVSEIIGTIAGSEGAPFLLSDALRFLRKDGVMIPHSATTNIAAVMLPEEFRRKPAFSAVGAPYVGKIFERYGYKFDLRLCIKGIGREHLVSTIGIAEHLDFRRGCPMEYVRREQLVVTRASRMDGLLLWLGLNTGSGEVLDIIDADYSWLPVYCPVFQPGLQVFEGDVLDLTISATPSANTINPDYWFEGSVLRDGVSVTSFVYESPHSKKQFRKNRFYADLFGGATLPIDDGPGGISAGDLRDYLRRRIPYYAVPSRYVFVERLPLSSSGKLDRKALLSLGRPASGVRDRYEPPRGELERAVAKLWEQLLKVERVGRHDNFFALGGHSILALRFVARLAQTCELDVTLANLIENPVLREFVKTLHGRDAMEEVVNGSNPRQE